MDNKDEKKKENEKEDEELQDLINDLTEGGIPEEDLNKFVSGLEKKMKQKKNNMGIAYLFGLVLSKKPLIHLLLVSVFNVSLLCALEGFFHFVEYSRLLMFGIGILLFTVVEFIFKMILIKFMLKVVLSTFGAIFVLLQIAYMELLYYFLPGFSFDSQLTLIAFVLVFMISRYVITRVGHAYVGNIRKKRM